MLLVQQPVALVFYTKNNRNKFYKRVPGELLTDKAHSYQLYKKQTAKTYSISEANKQGLTFIRVFNTNYYVLAFWVNDETNTPKSFNYIHIKNTNSPAINSIEDYLYSCLYDIFQVHEDSFSPKNMFSRKFSDAVSLGIRDLHKTCKKNKNNKNNKLCHESIDTNEVYNKIQKSNVFGDIYTESKEAFTLLDSYQLPYVREYQKNVIHQIPNVFFMLRDYGREMYRKNGEYDYNVRFLFSNSQLENTTDAFINEFAENHAQSFAKLSFQHLRHRVDSEEILQLEPIVNNSIRDALNVTRDEKDVGAKGIKEFIFETMSSVIGSDTRSFSDSVFSGVLHYKNPFCAGGMNRIGNSPQYIEESKLDQQRVMLANYLFQMMLPRTKSKKIDISMMLIPVFVGGTVYGVLGHIISDSRHQDEHYYNDNQRWNSTFTFYDTFYARISIAIRRKLIDTYLDSYFEGLSGAGLQFLLTNTFIEHNRSEAIIKVSEYSDNKQSLTRFFPFQEIKLKLQFIENTCITPDPNRFTLFNGAEIVLEFSNNQYFDYLIPQDMEKTKSILEQKTRERLIRILKYTENYLIAVLKAFETSDIQDTNKKKPN